MRVLELRRGARVRLEVDCRAIQRREDVVDDAALARVPEGETICNDLLLGVQSNHKLQRTSIRGMPILNFSFFTTTNLVTKFEV